MSKELMLHALTARKGQDPGRAAEVSVEQGREGTKAKGLVDGRWLERTGHRHEMAGRSRGGKGRTTRRA